MIRENFTGGMSEVLPAENLPAGVAASIRNMYIDKDGSLKARRTPRIKDNIQFETKHAYAWKPAYMPSDALSGEDTVYPYFGDGGCLLWYKTSASDWSAQQVVTIGTIATDTLRCSQDSQQFVFVDGRDNRGAQRITIDNEGAVHCRRFGTEQPKTSPSVKHIDNDRFLDAKFTGMPVGSILYYCYCIVNEYGERSNPSPITVCDTAQWLAKGENLVDEYVYSDVNGGSIKAVSVQCAIPQPEEAKRIELYRASAEYFESPKPLDPLRLVLSQALQAQAESVTLTDTQFATALEADYENDSAPAGDDIVIDNGTVFIANAVNEASFAYPVDSAWTITLNNRNDLNYCNRWFTIDIRDEAHSIAGALEHFAGLTSAASLITDGRYRLIDSDMVTPLNAYMRSAGTGWGSLQRLAPNGYTGLMYGALTHIQIPYLQANAEKVIYLVKFHDAPASYGSNATAITDDASTQGWLNTLIDNPVRDGNCVVAQGKVVDTTPVTGGWQAKNGNKANAILNTPQASGDFVSGTSGQSYAVSIYDEAAQKSLASENLLYYNGTDSRGWVYPAFETMPVPIRGYICGHVKLLSNAGAVQLFTLTTDVPDDSATSAQGFDKYKVRGALTAYTDYLELKLEYVTAADPALGNLWSTNDTVQDTKRLAITGLPVGWNSAGSNAFVFVSWQEIQELANPDTDRNDVTMGLVLGTPTLNKVKTDTQEHYNYFSQDVLHSRIFNFNYAATGLWYLNIGEYVSDLEEILTFSRFGTHFTLPANVIGIRSAAVSGVTIGGNAIADNLNVSIDTLALTNDKRPGRVRWSNGGAMPNLYEQVVNQEVMRAFPMRSFQPTDEHNTLLLWTDTDVLQMPLVGANQEASTLITRIKGIGLQDRDAIVQVKDGIIWSERTGIYYLSANGLKEIGKGRITLQEFTALYNHNRREVLFIGSDGICKVYNLDWDAWTDADFGFTPEGILEFDGVWCLLSSGGTYELEPADDDTTLSPQVLTRKYPARTKINRLTLHSSAGTVKCYVHNHRLAAGYAVTPEYSLRGDDPKAIPQLSGDHVQFQIKTDSVNYIDVEVKDVK